MIELWPPLWFSFYRNIPLGGNCKMLVQFFQYFFNLLVSTLASSYIRTQTIFANTALRSHFHSGTRCEEFIAFENWGKRSLNIFLLFPLMAHRFSLVEPVVQLSHTFPLRRQTLTNFLLSIYLRNYVNTLRVLLKLYQKWNERGSS